jgi:hypothetical protein
LYLPNCYKYSKTLPVLAIYIALPRPDTACTARF